MVCLVCAVLYCSVSAEDIARDHPDLYRVWREEPERFCLDGRYPVLDAFRQSRRAWTGEQLIWWAHTFRLCGSVWLVHPPVNVPPEPSRAARLLNSTRAQRALCQVHSGARGQAGSWLLRPCDFDCAHVTCAHTLRARAVQGWGTITPVDCLLPLAP